MSTLLPIELYGPEVSYFTGKLEAVLLYKELAYQRIPEPPGPKLRKETGVAQVPGVRLADGRWMTDTTPIITWLDEQFPETPVIPADPVLAFLSRLVEDYADEWLWRPAMHYRWDYDQDAYHLSRVLADEMGDRVPVPKWLLRARIRRRQRGFFTRGDGVTAETWDHVEKGYLEALEHLKAIFEDRPYLLGARPSLADFGYFGPMFRHFGHDPTAIRIMRETAPSVYEWTARLWNARASRDAGDLLPEMPADWGPILDTIGSAYLPCLCANAQAFAAGASHHDMEIEGVRYRNLRTSRYRVWCLEELRRHFEALADAERDSVRKTLEAHGCWEPLWRVPELASGVDPDRQAPFAPGHPMTGQEVE